MGAGHLYGNVALHIAETIASQGLRLALIDFKKGEVEFDYSDESRDEYIYWAEESLRGLHRLRIDGLFKDLAEAATKAVSFSLANPLQASVPSESGESYAILFERLRAIAITELARPAWTSAYFDEAANYYYDLLAGSRLGWDHDTLSTNTAEAGLRLALAGSRAGEAQLTSAALSCYPQFIARLNSRDELLPGEVAPVESSVTLRALCAYAHDEKGRDRQITAPSPHHGAMLNISIPASLNRRDAPRLLDHVPSELDGGMALWLKKQSSVRGSLFRSIRLRMLGG